VRGFSLRCRPRTKPRAAQGLPAGFAGRRVRCCVSPLGALIAAEQVRFVSLCRWRISPVIRPTNHAPFGHRRTAVHPRQRRSRRASAARNFTAPTGEFCVGRRLTVRSRSPHWSGRGVMLEPGQGERFAHTLHETWPGFLSMGALTP